jgi:hypothetical protein
MGRVGPAIPRSLSAQIVATSASSRILIFVESIAQDLCVLKLHAGSKHFAIQTSARSKQRYLTKRIVRFRFFYCFKSIGHEKPTLALLYCLLAVSTLCVFVTDKLSFGHILIGIAILYLLHPHRRFLYAGILMIVLLPTSILLPSWNYLSSINEHQTMILKRGLGTNSVFLSYLSSEGGLMSIVAPLEIGLSSVLCGVLSILKLDNGRRICLSRKRATLRFSLFDVLLLTFSISLSLTFLLMAEPHTGWYRDAVSGYLFAIAVYPCWLLAVLTATYHTFICFLIYALVTWSRRPVPTFFLIMLTTTGIRLFLEAIYAVVIPTYAIAENFLYVCKRVSFDSVIVPLVLFQVGVLLKMVTTKGRTE